jgi:pyrimidine-nucleoside phosphorylase
VHESVEVLSGRGEPDLVELTLALGAQMLLLGEAAKTKAEGRARISEVLKNGSALERFHRCVTAQGGKYPRTTSGWFSSHKIAVGCEPGYVQAIDAQAVGLAALKLGAGRTRKEDAIDPAVWVHLDKKVGEVVKAGESVASFSGPANQEIVEHVTLQLRRAYTIGTTAPAKRPLVQEIVQ